MKLRKIRRLIPYCSIVGLGMLGLVMINPAVCNLDNSAGSTYAAETSPSTGTSMSLIIDGWTSSDGSNDSVSGSVLATNARTAYISHDVTVDISNAISYTLQLTAADGKSSNLVHENGNTTITGAGGAKGSEMKDNTWGYSWDSTDVDITNLPYYTLPSYGATTSSISNGLLESANIDSSGNTSFTKRLTFAAKFGNDVPDGVYSTEALVSLAVSPKELPVSLGFTEYTTFDQVTKSVCNTIPIGTEGRLKDSRDGKIYWVARLKDGNCWMTQNLNYTYGSSSTSFNSSDTVAKYYSPGGGAYYNITPTTSTNSCSIIDASVGFSNCTDMWEIINGTLLTTSEIEDKEAANNLHYTTGKYYNWAAATAGTGSSIKNGLSATGSICPTNWGLPTPSNFENLTATLTGNDIVKAPYYFLAGGKISGSNVFNAGSTGTYWTSKSYDQNSLNFAYATSFTISSSTPNAAHYETRGEGISVRCVAK